MVVTMSLCLPAGVAPHSEFSSRRPGSPQKTRGTATHLMIWAYQGRPSSLCRVYSARTMSLVLVLMTGKMRPSSHSVIRLWLLLLLPLLLATLLAKGVESTGPSANEREQHISPAGAVTIQATVIFESTRRALNIEKVLSLSEGASAGGRRSPLTTQPTPTTQILHLNFALADSDVPLLLSSALWVCHTLQPLASLRSEKVYSRTECSPFSSAPHVPTVTWLSLEEAPGTYTLHSYVIPASSVTEPLSIQLGPGLEDFPATLQLPRPGDEMVRLARLFCTIMKDRIPQRVEGCAHKIVLQAQELFEGRLLGALHGMLAGERGNDGGGTVVLLQHHLTFGPALLRADDDNTPLLDQQVNEKLLLSRAPMSYDPGACMEVMRDQARTTAEGLAMVQVQPPQGRQHPPPPRLLCLTYTISSRHEEEVRGLTETWARRCDGYLAMSNLTDAHVPALLVPHDGVESYFNMWQKVRAIWRAVWRLYREQYDFFYLGGDDVYLIPDNLRRLLVRLNASADDPWYLGRRLQEEGRTAECVYQSGGAGYVLSREAVRRLVEEGMENSFCRPRDVALWEDVNVGHCMRFLGIEATDTRDEQGRETFHYQTPAYLLQQGRKGEISPDSVSFHYIRKRRSMHVIDALLYGGCQGPVVSVPD